MASAVKGRGLGFPAERLPPLTGYTGAPAYTDQEPARESHRGLTDMVTQGERRQGIPGTGPDQRYYAWRDQDAERDEQVEAQVAKARHLAAAKVRGDSPQPWQPDWVIAPALTLAEWLDEHPENVLCLALNPRPGARLDRATARAVRDVLARKPFGQAEADALEWGTGVPARMWLALEHTYRAGLAAGLHDASGP